MTDPDVMARVQDMMRERGTDYEHLIKLRRERERLRKREARKRQTPEQRDHQSERKRETRKQQTSEQRERDREGKRSRKKLRPFMPVDGEGGGMDGLGRQNYFLMCASGQAAGEEYILHRGGAALSTCECLEFILSLPADPILVGFGFGYDANQILRGMKQTTQRQILNPRQGKNGPCYTYWGDYAIIYQQGQYFRVARIDRNGPKPAVIKGSCRTIYETITFFQCSFVKAINDWKIGNEEERAIIAANKMQRDEFLQLTDTIIGYCKLECCHLAMLMTEFREVCMAAGISPKQWSGAGWLASALLEKHGTPKRPRTAREVAALAERNPSKSARPSGLRRPERDLKFETAANRAYYGGRFETSRIGAISGPVYKYDIRSAYPAGMCHLPCPQHTRWEHKPSANRSPESGIYLAKVCFSHPDGPWCGLPFRHKGGLFWPLQGTGWYWSPEIDAARRHLQANIAFHDLWIARQDCNCQLFKWVNDLYEERRRIGSNTRGYPLKLGLNSLYGDSVAPAPHGVLGWKCGALG